MNKKRAYINRGKAPIVIGDVTIKPGTIVNLDESAWAEADETPKLYQDFSETVGQIVELVK